MASTLIEMPAPAKAQDRRLELLRSAPMNSWLALSADESRIVAIGKTFVEADATAKKSGEENYILTRTPDAWMSRCLSPTN
ncbi:MAG: hypothetical protein WA485_25945 [Candidatus Sulfotelmatobacter sp.]